MSAWSSKMMLNTSCLEPRGSSVASLTHILFVSVGGRLAIEFGIRIQLSISEMSEDLQSALFWARGQRYVHRTLMKKLTVFCSIHVSSKVLQKLWLWICA